MMRFTRLAALCLFLAFMCIPPGGASAQTEVSLDPFLGQYAIGKSAEIIVSTSPDFVSTTSYHQIFDFLSTGNLQEIVDGPEQTHTGNFGAKTRMDVASADYNGDGYDEFLTAWVDHADFSVNFMIPNVDTTTLGWTPPPTQSIPGDLAGDNTFNRSIIRVMPGHFDRDPASEFVIAYHDKDDLIRIRIYDADTTLIPVEKATIADEVIPKSLGVSARFDVSVGDFDGDGFDEIFLVGVDPDFDGLGRWAFFTKLYDVDADGDTTPAIIPHSRETNLFDRTMAPDSSYAPDRLVATTGRITGAFTEQVVVGFQIFGNNLQDTQIHLQPLEVASDLSGVIIDPEKRILADEYSGGRGWPLSLGAGDLDTDGIDEVVVTNRNTLRVIKSDPDLILTEFVKRSTLHNDNTADADENHRIVAMRDLNANETDDNWFPEIVVANKYSDGASIFGGIQLQILSLSYNEETMVYSLTEKATHEYDRDFAGAAMDLGNFDGDGVRIGSPTVYTESKVFQPLVVLNAPPIHFDVLDGTPHDVNKCFSGGSCDFKATYEEGLSQEVQVTTEVNSDWALSNKIFAEVEAYGNKVAAHLQTTVGLKFSNVERLRNKITVGLQVDAVHDDLIYGTVGDYDLWEYPLYADGEFLDYMVVIVPRIFENRWFPAKTWSGRTFIPNHEVGNVLSYAEYEDFSENEYLNETIKGATNNSYALASNTSYEWRLEFEDFQENEAKETLEIGIEIGAEVSRGVEADFYGKASAKAGLELKANYNRTQTSTHTTSVQQDLLLKIRMGSVAGDEMGYRINPYAFWANNGALVIDYSVSVDQAPKGFTPTWWQASYGMAPDPAFILPWRYDPEKGSALQDEAKRLLSRDIVFDTTTPAAGDTVTVFARVHNYSLLPTNAPVDVSFYIGDPDGGGSIINALEGETVVSTEEALPARGNETVSMEWVVPPGLEAPRIYAVLDPANAETEIHETNNKAWNVLGANDDPGGVAVLLAYFTGERNLDQVHLRWGVASVEDHLGFHVYRETGDANRERASETMLAGRTDYEFVDSVGEDLEVEYWLAEVSRAGVTTWHGPLSVAPASAPPVSVALSPAFPNPFVARSTIAYVLGSEGPVNLSIWDVRGRQVGTLVDTVQPAGYYSVEWDGMQSNGTVTASGIYFVRLAAGEEVHTQKIMRLAR